jgi:hypothetical protein
MSYKSPARDDMNAQTHMLWFELKALSLLDRGSITWATPIALWWVFCICSAWISAWWLLPSRAQFKLPPQGGPGLNPTPSRRPAHCLDSTCHHLVLSSSFICLHLCLPILCLVHKRCTLNVYDCTQTHKLCVCTCVQHHCKLPRS